MIVGEPSYDNGLTNQGRVRVFFGNKTGIIDSTPEVTITGGGASRTLGAALASGDLLGDDYGDVAIGSPDYSNPSTGEGRVLVRSGQW
jgi:hypothetical protein